MSSEPLSTERFEAFVEDFTAKHSETADQLASIVGRLDKVDGRLDAIEQLLWQGKRVDELEKRLRELAQATGHADLATPILRPLGQ